MQWQIHADDKLRAHEQPPRQSDSEVEPRVFEAWDREGFVGRFAVVARQDRDSVTVIPLDGDEFLAQYERATLLVDPERMYEYDRERFLAAHPVTWTEAVSAAAVEAHVRRFRTGVPFDDNYDTAERNAIQREPMNCWHRLRHWEV